ncbi:BAG family molecular chaperone regulator 4 [Anas platyrhynchos]|uniref:BAG family molecular chaperone regulator 4 n=1 Tax=Anas platyrhynchos TaxID=8839 RepID=UPI003AF2242A
MEPRGSAAPWAPGPPAGQGMDSPYSTGAYSAPYPPAAPHYPGPPQPRGFGSSGPPRSPYPAEPPARYRPPPAPAAPWGYGTADSLEAAPLRRQHGPGYSPPQTPGMPVPQYPYGDGHLGTTPQGPQPRPQEDAWAPPTAYGAQPRNAWTTAHGTPFGTDPHPAWGGGSGAASYPPPRDSKETAYDKPDPSPNQHNYYCDVSHQQAGATSDHKAPPAPPAPRVQYSAQPQMYGAAPRKPPAGKQEGGLRGGEQIQPEIQRILHITRAAAQLEQEVDEFVGKKTDKSYRLLEEMLTKLLLELDSIETGGQDGVRQARKEAVHRIQAILEILERKGL